MLTSLALGYGLMSLALYSGGFAHENLDPLARILASGTVICVGLNHLATLV